MGAEADKSKEKPPELLDVVDPATGLVVESGVARDRIHAEGLWHRTVHIYVMRQGPDGLEVLVHLRSPKRKQYPNTLDPAMGGHVKTGKSPEETALDELEQEVGLSVRGSELIPCGEVKKDDPVHAPNDREINNIFIYWTKPEDQMDYDEEEIAGTEWVSLDALQELHKKEPTAWRPSEAELANDVAKVRAKLGQGM